MSISLGGFFSGIDSSSIIAQLTALNRQPEVRLAEEKSKLSEQSSAFAFIQSSLSGLRSTLTTLNDINLYKAKAASTSDATIAAASVDYTATAASVAISITQVATNSVLTGGKIAGAYVDTKLSAVPAAAADISNVLGTTSYDGKTFSVNGKTITLATSDTITGVLTKINSSGAGVTATYDASTGKFDLASASTIILGSGADTSDFLQRAQLFNNGTNSVTSNIGAGRVDSTTALAGASLRSGAALTAGTFTVNGISITYTAGDSLDTVLTNINNSSAGVIASFDSYTDRLVLTSKNRGAQNITVADGTSNLATALRLTSTDSSTSVGNATKFTVGTDATVRQSEDQTLTAAELGLTGVTVTAISTGDVTINVSNDAEKIKKSIDAFVSQYNSAQNLVKSYTLVDPNDLTRNGKLASDSTVSFLPSTLRSSTTAALTSSGTIRMLEDLGIVGNSTDNTLTLTDSSKLQDALLNYSQEVIDLFTNSTTGLDKRLGSILDSYATTGTGILATRQTSITNRQQDIDNEIARIELQVLAEETYLKASFANLESTSGNSQQLSSFFQ